MLLVLSRAACLHLAYLSNERAWRDTGLLPPEAAYEMRERFIRVALGTAETVAFTLTPIEVRAMDMLLTDSDPREGKLPSGEPILGLVEYIWRLLIGAEDAGHDHEDDHIHAHPDDGTAVHRP